MLNLTSNVTIGTSEANFVFNPASGSALRIQEASSSTILDLQGHTFEVKGFIEEPANLTNITLNNAYVQIDSSSLELGSGAVLTNRDTFAIGTDELEFGNASTNVVGMLTGAGYAYGGTANLTIDTVGLSTTDTFAGNVYTTDTLD